MPRIALVVLCLLFLAVVPLTHADEIEDIIYNAETLTLDHTIDSSITVSYQSRSASLESLSAYVSFFPRDSYRQKVHDVSYDPQPARNNDTTLTFTWDDPAGRLDFSINGLVTTTSTMPAVTKKIPFPLTEIPPDLLVYLGDSPNIDITKGIRQQANEISQGNDDLFVVVHDMANWVEENIEYSLNTVTAEAALPASWVFEQRQGVCDELTLLFIAMLRSVGIPARLASGISYTSSVLFDDKWGSHAWAEVYFPDVGWVPFDITYRQFGFIDASHIKLRDANDGNSSLTHYEWNGHDLENVDIDLDALRFTTSITASSGDFDHPLRLQPSLPFDEMGFSSYGRLDVTVNNPSNAYLSAPLSVYSTQEVKFEESDINLLVAPRSSATASFIFELNGDFERGYTYTLPVEVVTQWHEPARTTLHVAQDYPLYKRTQVLPGTKKREGITTHAITMECVGPQRVGVNQRFTITCTLDNKGNAFYDALQVCIENTCEHTSLGITETIDVALESHLSAAGNHPVDITVPGHPELQAILPIIAEERPVILVKEISAPASVAYGDTFDVSFVLETSGSAHDIVVKLDNDASPIIWRIDSLAYSQPFVAQVESSFLAAGTNKPAITVTYHDAQGNAYTTQEQFSIQMEDVGFFTRIWLTLLHTLQRI